METHKDLEVWKDSLDLIEMIYKKTNTFPNDEKVGLVSQMRRAAVAIPSNIAEGYARNYTKEKIRYLYIALGSASELETQLIISGRLNYPSSDEINNQLEKTRRKLINLIKYHRSKGKL
jgi:four helix bundle protein